MENDSIANKQRAMVRQVAESAGVSEEDARKVLNVMGLDNVFNEVSKLGVNVESINPDSLKAAIRLSKNTIPV